MTAGLSHLPLALGGDALSGNNIAIAAVGLLSIAIGYALLAALWFFVFRQKPEERDAERRAHAEALERRRAASAASAAPTPTPTPPDRPDPPRGAAKLERRPGPRFRRR